MKIRDGFVSNSSSTAFILVKPKEYMSLSDVKEYYSISKDVPKEVADWFSIIVWDRINHKDSSDTDCLFEDFLDKETIEWKRRHKYEDHTDEWYDKVRENQKEAEHVRLDISTDYYDYEYSDLKFPFDVIYDISKFEDEIFTDPRKAFKVYGH